MRIDIVKPVLYKVQNGLSPAIASVNLPAHQHESYKSGLNLPVGYFVSFNGYREDRSFILGSKQALDDTMQRVIDYYNEDNYEFEDALEILHQNNNNEYRKVTNSVDNFKTYEQGFNDFNETVLNSIKDVQYGQLQFGKFWMENSRIGSKKTVDIIKQITGAQDDNINEVLKNLDYEQKAELRQELITEWFKNAGEVINDFAGAVHNNNKKLYKELEKQIGTRSARQFLKEQESYYTSEFNRITIDKILDNKTSNEQKKEAFNAILNYLENQLKTEDSQSMESHLETILDVRKHLKYGIDKESVDYVENDFKSLYDIAITDWQKTSLPKLINNSLNKVIYVNKTEKEIPVMTTIPGYSELSPEQKYFVAKYYAANNNGLKDNMLKQIIQDRDIMDPSAIVDTITLKVENDRQKYFNQLDTFYDYLKDRKTNPDLDVPEIDIAHRKGVFSFINQYLFELDKLEDYNNKSTKDKLDYLSTLTNDELRIANEKIKRSWDENELQYLIETEVKKQAKYTSINSKMYEELCKINVNLNDIKVKLDNITVSLKDLLDNRYIIKDETEIKKAIQNSSTVLADAEREYFTKTPQEQLEADLKMRETMPVVIDNLIQKTDDKDIIEQLTLVKTKCKNPKTRSNEIISMLKTIAVGRAMGLGMNKGCNKLGHLLQNSHHLHAPLTDVGNLGDAVQGFDITDAGMQVLQGATVSAAAHAAAGSSSLSSIFTAIPPVDPITAAIAITVATISAGVIAAKKATKLEKQQRELYVEFSK